MLLLVVAHGDIVRLIEQDVRRHQGGVGEEAAVDVVGIFRRLVFELGHAAELAEHSVAVEHPTQLRVGGDMGLDEQGVLLRVQAAGDVLGQLLQSAAAQGGGVLPHGNGVHVRHKVVVVKLVGALHPVLDGPQIGAKGQISAGLDAGEHDFFLLCFHNPHNLFRKFPNGGPGRSAAFRLPRINREPSGPKRRNRRKICRHSY